MTYTGKTYEIALEKAMEDLQLPLEKLSIEVVQECKKGFLGLGSKDCEIHVTYVDMYDSTQKLSHPEKNEGKQQSPKKENINLITVDDTELQRKIEKVKGFINSLVDELNYEVEVFVNITNESVEISLLGPNVGGLIGKRGETLYSIQYLINIIANQNDEPRVKFFLDIENFKKKREKTLVNLGISIGKKVASTGESITLEPMNPLERKIIHSTLQSNKDVITESHGEEGGRYIVVKPKKA